MTNAPPPRADREAIARVIEDIACRWIYRTAHNGPDHLCSGIGNEAASAVLALGVLHPLLSAIAEAERALEPFAEIAKHAKGKPDDCWCGQYPAVIRYSDLSRAASALTALRAIPAMTGAADPRNREEASGWRPTHRHVKRGTEYEYLGWGRAQCSESGLLDDEHVAIYRGEDGSLWARRLAEFNDGRFEDLPPPPSQESEG